MKIAKMIISLSIQFVFSIFQILIIVIYSNVAIILVILGLIWRYINDYRLQRPDNSRQLL